MKKAIVGCVIAGLTVLTLVPAHAGATGTILLPTVITGTEDANEDPCLPGDAGCQKLVATRQQRCAGAANNGVVGWTFSVTAGTAFTLKSVPANTADFDIVFYTTIKACQANQPEGSTASFAHFGNGAETGIVPSGMTKAIVVLFGNANQTFIYA